VDRFLGAPRGTINCAGFIYYIRPAIFSFRFFEIDFPPLKIQSRFREGKFNLEQNMKTFLLKNIRFIVLILGFAALCFLTGCEDGLF